MQQVKQKRITSFLVGTILGIIIAGGTASAAILYQSSQVSYSNSSSGLSATTVQGALDELSTKCSSCGSGSGSGETYTYKYVVSTTQVKIGSTIPSSAKAKTTAAQAMAQWNSWVGYNNGIYIKHKLNSNNIVVDSYVEVALNNSDTSWSTYFNGTTLSFLGDRGSAGSTNKTTLNNAVKNSSYCSSSSSTLTCGDDYSVGVSISNSGDVNAYDYCSGGCRINQYGTSSCSYDTSGC